MTDEILLRRLKAQEPEALETMMNRYNKLVYTIIYNMIKSTGGHADVEELVSDTFFSVWNHAQNIDHGKLKAYLTITARNKAKSFLRSRRPLAMDIDEIDLPDSADNPEDTAMAQELQQCVKKAIGKMRPSDREIFLRYYYYLQSSEEIAEEMHMPSSTIRTRLARGRKILKKHLSKEALF